jgi:hypothetical protein
VLWCVTAEDDEDDEPLGGAGKLDGIKKRKLGARKGADRAVRYRVGEAESARAATKAPAGGAPVEDDGPLPMFVPSHAAEFWRAMEEYFLGITDEQIKVLAATPRHAIDGDSVWHLPDLGRHFMDAWMEEDMREQGDEPLRDLTDGGARPLPKRVDDSTTRHSARLTDLKADDELPHGSASAQANLDCGMLTMPPLEHHAMLLRMQSLLIDQPDRLKPLAFPPDASGLADLASCVPLADGETFNLAGTAAQIEKRVQQEMYAIGLLDSMDYIDPAKREDDEICYCLRLERSKLAKQIQLNEERKARLMSIVSAALPADRKRKQIESLERAVDKQAERYLKDLKKKGRAGSSDKEFRNALRALDRVNPLSSGVKR